MVEARARPCRILKDHIGEVSLDEISEGLGVPKYGTNSAFALLHSLRSRGIVNRKEEMWVLLALDTLMLNGL